jgi:hypothetical protein
MARAMVGIAIAMPLVAIVKKAVRSGFCMEETLFASCQRMKVTVAKGTPNPVTFSFSDFESNK